MEIVTFEIEKYVIRYLQDFRIYVTWKIEWQYIDCGWASMLRRLISHRERKKNQLVAVESEIGRRISCLSQCLIERERP